MSKPSRSRIRFQRCVLPFVFMVKASTATWLPGALSAVTMSNSRSAASPGR
ncbi:Uncharacterised protein [Mycobacterium tuberculosis]|nr:Uncharacterised protein [Mycobacterium tuberculosis]CNL96263.1 Uncharacterised protein [Mycobacterium tuberculosis]CNM52762.1 Uncharacterised protein [Mycobacterium tuberculosis]CNM56864.1 Uncharacterised protein [Mycobacterium tuberculosis]CPA86569.1 Uncharacterised protein [Mycobacterium tuberculosis]